MTAGVAIAKVGLFAPIAQQLIAALDAELRARYPEEGATHFRLDAEEVGAGRGAFLVAYLDTDAVGCGALRTVQPGIGEIKRMYVTPAARGQGVGRAVLAALEGEARRLGIHRILLETGIRQTVALALYRRAGYWPAPPFGEYVDSPLSVCLAKDLDET